MKTDFPRILTTGEFLNNNKESIMAKDVAKKEGAALAVIDFTADAGAGFEDSDQKSYAIPFLSVLQSGSPQCKRAKGEYVEGAQEGMFFNSVSQELFDGKEGVVLLPCHYTRTFNEWTPRDSGGGLVAVHDAATGEAMLADCSKGPKGEDILPNGHILADTRNHYVLIIKPDGSYEPAFMPLGSTQIKKSKRWMTLMNNIRIGGQIAPMFSQLYRFTTVPESNDKGDWFGVDFKHIGAVSDIAHYTAAKQFREMVRSGVAKPADTGARDIPC
jgi:hypothetical protein